MGLLTDVRDWATDSLNEGSAWVQTAWAVWFAALALFFALLPDADALQPYRLGFPLYTAALLAAAFVLGPWRGAVVGLLFGASSTVVNAWRLQQRFPDEFQSINFGEFVLQGLTTTLLVAAFVAVAGLLARAALREPPRLSLGALWALAGAGFLLVVGGAVALVGWTHALGRSAEGLSPVPASALPLAGLLLAVLAAGGWLTWRRGREAFDAYAARAFAGVAALYWLRVPLNYFWLDLWLLVAQGRPLQFLEDPHRLDIYGTFALMATPSALLSVLLAVLFTGLLVGSRAPGAPATGGRGGPLPSDDAGVDA